MAGNIWLKIADAKGEGLGTFADWMAVDFFEWGVTRKVEMSKTAGVPGASSMNSLRVKKKIDRASPTLMLFCLVGEKKDAELKVTDDAKTVYYHVTMTKAQLAKVLPTQGENAGGEETLELAFETVKVVYTPPDPSGGR